MFKSLLEEILLLRNPCNQVNNDSTLNKNSHRMTVRIYSKQKKKTMQLQWKQSQSLKFKKAQ